jgi:hypothetical protein
MNKIVQDGIKSMYSIHGNKWKEKIEKDRAI